MIDPKVFLRMPITFNNICTIYPPSVKDILSNPKFFQLYKLLIYSQEDIDDLFAESKDKQPDDLKTPTPLEFILINSYKNNDFKTLIESAFLEFIHEPITLIYNSKLILIGEIDDLSQTTDFSKFRCLTEDNFFTFQNLIRASMGDDAVVPPEPEENPIVKRVKAAARRRKRLAEKNRGKNGKGISLTTTLGAICCMGIGLTPLNIGEISYASIGVLMSLYQQKEKYQTDIDSLMAGANPKKVHPKYWIREKSEFNEN